MLPAMPYQKPWAIVLFTPVNMPEPMSIPPIPLMLLMSISAVSAPGGDEMLACSRRNDTCCLCETVEMLSYCVWESKEACQTAGLCKVEVAVLANIR